MRRARARLAVSGRYRFRRFARYCSGRSALNRLSYRAFCNLTFAEFRTFHSLVRCLEHSKHRGLLAFTSPCQPQRPH